MKIIITNDDGIDAPGLQALAAAAQTISTPILVAPTSAHSGCSHRVTTDTPFRVALRSPQAYAVEGTPADCVRVALHEIAPEVQWVLSGINAGGNLGADVHHSGTVAAVREAVIHGRPGIAISHYHRRGVPIDWERAARWVGPVLARLMQEPWQGGTFWNINLPHLDPSQPDPEVVFCPLDFQPLPLSFKRDGDVWHYNGNYHDRRRQPGHDVDVCFRGQIAVTKLVLY